MKVAIEVKGIKGMDSKLFRKEFKSLVAFEKWMEKNKDDVSITGIRGLEEPDCPPNFGY